MATRFEIVIHGDDPLALRAAGEEALAEVERLDQQLSLYQPTSEIARLNADAAHEWVRVTPVLFRLLQDAQQLSRETLGAFDITVAPLIRCWGFMGGGGHLPQPAAVEEAKAKVGMHWVELDEQNFAVHFARAGVMLDLGAIGKGCAIDRAADRLREAGVTSAILHGGTSTIYAIGAPPAAEAWKVAIEYPAENPADRPLLLATVPLQDEALSVSAVWGKSFQSGGTTYGHVIDPRNGQPVTGAALAAVALPSATETDALSTALLTLGVRGLGQVTGLRSGMRTLVVEHDEISRRMRIATNGIALEKLPAQRTEVVEREKER
jgi:thiamine biosynthesis lipoprotein